MDASLKCAAEHLRIEPTSESNPHRKSSKTKVDGMEKMLVFDQYPERGRTLLGIMRGATCRRDYGAEFIRITGQRACAYCGEDLLARFDLWLSTVLDHVVPVSVCKAMQIPNKWCHDYSNAVLSCAACNGFCNRYKPSPWRAHLHDAVRVLRLPR